jgi:hypothetical protein
VEIYGSSLAIAPRNEVILSANEPDEATDPSQNKNRFGRPRIGDVLSVHLSQNAGSTAVWAITVFVQVAQGFFILGPAVITNPPSGATPDPPARTILFASCPGAIGWKVACDCATDGEIADIVLQSSQCCGGATFGVIPNVFVPPGGGGG